MQGVVRRRRMHRILCSRGALMGAMMGISLLWLIFSLIPQWTDWQSVVENEEASQMATLVRMRRSSIYKMLEGRDGEDDKPSEADREKQKENDVESGDEPPQAQHLTMEDARRDLELGGARDAVVQEEAPKREESINASDRAKEEEKEAEDVQDDEDEALAFAERGHTFYYPWYDNPEHNRNQEYLHWNHEVLASYEPGSRNGPAFVPPEQIGANFYPKLGCYSSVDPDLIREHMRMIRQAGLGVITVSWYPPAYSDGQIQSNPGFSDATLTSLLDIAHEFGIKVNFHVEPYAGRSEETLHSDIHYVIDKYGDHPAFYRHHQTKLPMFYVYDSYHTNYNDWAKLLGDPNQHPKSIRGTPYDAMVIALFVGAEDYDRIPLGKFDGVYTYFATDGFTHGSTTANWPRLAEWAKRHDMIFIPSIGPGYEDTRIRPWNARNSRRREGGRYYDRMMQAAAALPSVPDIISITSWNEWHEGTQIEPAVPKKTAEFTYMDYGPDGPDHYLHLTRRWMRVFAGRWRSPSS